MYSNWLLLPPANEVCEGYVFTRVCLSTGEYLGRHPQASTPPWAGTPPGQLTPLGRYTHSLGRCTPQAGTPPGQVHHPSGQVHHPSGQVLPRGRYTSRTGTPPATVHAGIRSTSRRYASHWNAFLYWDDCSWKRLTFLCMRQYCVQRIHWECKLYLQNWNCMGLYVCLYDWLYVRSSQGCRLRLVGG